ncbi:MAG: transcriptional repressor [Rickettsiales bacterium]|jgi:Fur family transcriptional regulator, ferric uptake regulator|nr:transcriptional repressor [Rickettsiales bacterium]
MNDIVKKFIEFCKDNSIKITEQRKAIVRVVADSKDHPDVDQIYSRAKLIDNKISIATVYRTVKLLESAKIVEKHDFGDGKARYEVDEDHHDHIINVKTGEIIEFCNEEVEKLQKSIVEDLGYELIYHKLELYVVSKKKD